MTDTEPEPFRYDVEVKTGVKRHLRYEISETSLGDPVGIPVTINNVVEDGPTGESSAFHN